MKNKIGIILIAIAILSGCTGAQKSIEMGSPDENVVGSTASSALADSVDFEISSGWQITSQEMVRDDMELVRFEPIYQVQAMERYVTVTIELSESATIPGSRETSGNMVNLIQQQQVSVGDNTYLITYDAQLTVQESENLPVKIVTEDEEIINNSSFGEKGKRVLDLGDNDSNTDDFDNKDLVPMNNSPKPVMVPKIEDRVQSGSVVNQVTTGGMVSTPHNNSAPNLNGRVPSGLKLSEDEDDDEDEE